MNDVRTIAIFAWGGAIRNGASQTAMYVRRLYRGLCRHATVPFRVVLFVDAQNADMEVPLGVEKREFDMFEWEGCLPKLFAHSPDSGLTGRVVIMDLDTIVCGDVDPLLKWDGGFISRADEVLMKRGTVCSGGNMQSFEAGSTRVLWDSYADNPDAFRMRTSAQERRAIREYIDNQSFFQVEFPGMMRHIRSELGGHLPNAKTQGASVIVATGPLRPHLVRENGISEAWKSLDRNLVVRLVADHGWRDRNQLAPLLDAEVRRHLAAAGVSVVDSGAADVALMQVVAREDDTLLPTELPEMDVPIICLEKIDGAQVHPGHIDWMADPRVIGWMKAYRARGPAAPPSLHGRYHVAALEGRGDIFDYPAVPSLCWGFGRYAKVRQFVDREPDYDASRKTDVSFRGRTSFPYGPAGESIAAHRAACIRAMEGLPGAVIAESAKGRPFGPSDYASLMHNSKVAVSPWGYGESCIRDYEAMLSGCIVVKPDSRHVEALSDIYADGGPVVHCRPDWSDLPVAVKRALELYEDPSFRRSAREMALREWDDGMLARQLAGRLWKAASAAGVTGSGENEFHDPPPEPCQLPPVVTKLVGKRSHPIPIVIPPKQESRPAPPAYQSEMARNPGKWVVTSMGARRRRLASHREAVNV